MRSFTICTVHHTVLRTVVDQLV